MILLSRIPYPLEKGDKLRAFNQIKELSKSHDIYLFALNDQAIHPEAINILSKYCKEIHFYNLSKFSILYNTFKSIFNSYPFQIGYFFNKNIFNKINSEIRRINPEHIYCQLVRTSEYIKHLSIPKTIDYQDAFSKGIERRINKSLWYMRSFLKIEMKRLMNYNQQFQM